MASPAPPRDAAPGGNPVELASTPAPTAEAVAEDISGAGGLLTAPAWTSPIGEQQRLRRRRVARRGPEAEIESAVTLHGAAILVSTTDLAVWTGGSMAVGAGVPDVLVAAWRPELAMSRLLEVPDAQLLAYVRRVARASPETIAQRLGWPLKRVTRRLGVLNAIGILQTGSTRVSVAPAWRSILPEVVAIEAKVSKWRIAVAQAARNRLFAHRSFVALPDRLATHVRQRPVFSQTGVGLLGVSPTGTVRVLRRARRTGIRIWQYYYALALNLGQLLEGTASDLHRAAR